MERTKGQLHNHSLCIDIYAGIKHRRLADMDPVGTAYESNLKEQEANAEHLVFCWNAFEPDGPVDGLVKALEGMISSADLLEQDEGFPVCSCRKWVKEPCSYCIATDALAAYRKAIEEKT